MLIVMLVKLLNYLDSIFNFIISNWLVIILGCVIIYLIVREWKEHKESKLSFRTVFSDDSNILLIIICMLFFSIKIFSFNIIASQILIAILIILYLIYVFISIIRIINDLKSNNKSELIGKIMNGGIKYPLEKKFWFLIYVSILTILFVLIGVLLGGFLVLLYISILSLKTNVYSGLIVLFSLLFGILALILLELLLLNKWVSKNQVIKYILGASIHEKNESKFNYYWKYIKHEIHFLAPKQSNGEYIKILKGVEIYLITFEEMMDFEDKKNVVVLIKKATDQETVNILLEYITKIDVNLEEKHKSKMVILKNYLCVKYDLDSFNLFKFIFLVSKNLKEKISTFTSKYYKLLIISIILLSIILSALVPEFRAVAKWVLDIFM